MRAEPRPQIGLGLRRCSLAPSLQAISFLLAWPGPAPRRPWPESALLRAIPQGVGLAKHEGPSLCPLSRHYSVAERNFSVPIFSLLVGRQQRHRLQLSSEEEGESALLELRKEPIASLKFVSLER